MAIIFTSNEENFLPEEQKKIRERLLSLYTRYSEYLIFNPDLKKEDAINFADTITETEVSAIRAGIEFRGLDELVKAMKIVLDTSKKCDKAIEAFEDEHFRLKIEEAKKEQKFDYIKDLSPYEAFLKFYQVLIRDLTLNELKVQFANTNLNITFDDIDVKGKVTEGFDILVKFKDAPELFFQIFPNNGNFADITNNFIASSLKIASLQIQTRPEDYSKQGNNNFKSAQTVDKVIKREIRLLKIIIKEEIETLENTTAKAIERLEATKKIFNHFYIFLNKKTKEQLLKIMEETESIVSKTLEISENKISTRKIKQFSAIKTEIKNNNDTLEKIIKETNEIFTSNKNKSNFKTELDENKVLISFEIEELNLNLEIEDENILSIFVTSNNKEVYEQLNVFGKNLQERIKNSILFAYSIFIKNKIDSLLINTKKKKNHHLHKNIINTLENISKVLTAFSSEISEKIKIIIDNILILFNLLISLDEKLVKDILDILDKILEEIHREIEGVNGIKLSYDKENTVLAVYNLLKSEETDITDIFEIFNELKKYIEMSLTSNILIQVLNYYKKEQFDEEKTLYSNEDRRLKLMSYEQIIKDLANILSEDITVGSCARKVLSIMDRSITLRDNILKKDLENIISEIIKARKEFYHI